ncbi:MAG TPA: MscL family protein [Methanomicrobiales archaeon]|nr:MscL family protein [Methanomicrobiales archaeon]
MSLMSEFMDFLKEYKVIPLAIAFIMGVASTAVITALVNDIIMGFIKPLLPSGDWKTAVLNAGPFQFAWGDFLAALINFIIIAFVIFLVAKFMFKEEKVTKK